MTAESDKPALIKAASAMIRANVENTVAVEWIARRRYMKAARGGALVLPDAEMGAGIRQAIYARSLTILDDIARNDPEPRYRIRAAEVIQQTALAEMKLRAELESKRPFVETAQPAAADDSPPIPKSEQIAILRALAKQSP